jgi:glycine/D-amino acid oxidase-like deaminating enzyme
MKHSNYWFETCPTKCHNGVGFVKNVDVLIIGGGIAGISTLFQLVRAGFSNAYLLEEATVGYHASGRASGQLMLRGLELFTELSDRLGKDAAEEYLKFSAGNMRKFISALNRTKFDTDLRQNGGLRLATSKEELELLKREAAFINSFAKETGVNCIVLSESDVRSIIPSKGFLGGIYLPCESTVNPYKIVNGTRDLLETSGARVLTNSCVEKVERNEDDSLSVSIRHKGVINAKKVVYCMNAYSSSLLPELKDKFTPFRGQMVATDILPKAAIQTLPDMSMSCNNGSDYFRIHGDRLLLGGQRQNVRGQQEGIIYDGEISQTVFKRQKEFLQNHLPLIDVKFTHVWSGIMCRTHDGMPLVGELPNRKNEYIVAGFNGYGMSHAFMAGLIVRDKILKGKSSLPGAELFDPSR